MNKDNTFVFAGSFPKTSYEDWYKAVGKVLKKNSFEEEMLTNTYEGITISPIYSLADRPEKDIGYPGMSQFTRGSKRSGGDWLVSQEYKTADPKVVNAAILDDLENGVTSFLVLLDRETRTGPHPIRDNLPELIGVDGIALHTYSDFEALLRDVRLEQVPIALKAGNQFIATAAMLATVWKNRGIPNDKVVGAFNADPLGCLAEDGTLSTSVEAALAQMSDLAFYTAQTWPKVTAVNISTIPYHDAGAAETQDLACAIATGVAYIRAMTESGMTLKTACQQITFTFSVSCDFFMSIAKLRAARRLWARVTESCGITGAAQGARIHARTSERMMTRYDPWVNILRSTTAAFAAGVSGAESVTALPFDYVLGQPTDLSRRVSRNSQVILREEASLVKVIDPAGGSWYVESLTSQLAHAAWKLFQEIEGAGGMVQALESGLIFDQIAATWAAREKDISHRRCPITGVSEFPNIAEDISQMVLSEGKERLAQLAQTVMSANNVDVSQEAKFDKLGSITRFSISAAANGAAIGSIASAVASAQLKAHRKTKLQKPFPKYRLAETFEALRDKTAYKAASDKQPIIFLANLGPSAAYTARATYAKNFFEAGGIQTTVNDGFMTADNCVTAFSNSGANIAVLCSSDLLYQKYVSQVASSLKAKGCKFLFLAGNPGKDIKKTYLDAGVDDFIFMGCDVLGKLKVTLSQLGV